LKSPPENNFVKKDNYPPDVLDLKVLNWLEKYQTPIRKVIIWHWFTDNLNMAHIDSGPNGDTVTAAINWTLNDNPTQVNFYQDVPSNLTVKIADRDNREWNTNNVGSYIPIDVSEIQPVAIWKEKDPCLINPRLPHLVYAPKLRISVSLQFYENIPFLDLVRRYQNG
jgi:hypothetical protein